MNGQAVSRSKTHLFPSLLSVELDMSNSPSTSERLSLLVELLEVMQ